MKITAQITAPNDKEEIIIHNVDLIDIATRDNLLIINEASYKVCRTLFTKAYYDGQYDFEQVITNYPRKNLERYELYLLMGTIYFNAEEKFSILKNVTINYNTEYGNNIENVKAPYNYMRRYDCMRIGESAFMCDEIKVSENSEILIKLTHRQPLVDFRTDKNSFCQ